ncbi:unnamed protein product [Effrenium voratum]|nr:unnamed protein product [Effrenium voratum]
MSWRCACRRRVQVPPCRETLRLAATKPEVQRIGLADLSQEVLAAVLHSLQGLEVLAKLGPASRSLRLLLQDEHAETSLWPGFLKQEFPELERPGFAEAYRQLTARRLCRSIEWRQVPSRGLGQREGSPGMFQRRGQVFVFGGWGYGPMKDLHVANLKDVQNVQDVLNFREVPIRGAGPFASYEAKTTVLDDEDSDSDSFRVLVTGGWRHGGYCEESNMYGIMEINFEEAAVTARWLKVGEMVPRANHTATFVPPSIAGDAFPQGYVVVFGGCIDGQASNCLELLDLSSMQWLEPAASGETPRPRNSHSATLVRDADFGVLGPAILVAGGGTGDGSNGGPPRGGRDLQDAFWLRLRGGLDLDGLGLRWAPAAVPGAGRGHVAARLAGTSTVVFLGGGKPPLPQARSTGGDLEAPGRAFGGGCSLPMGCVLVYGGWHPSRGTFGDIWAAGVDDLARNSEFFQALPLGNATQEHLEDSDGEDPALPFNAALRRFIRQRELEGRGAAAERLQLDFEGLEDIFAPRGDDVSDDYEEDEDEIFADDGEGEDAAEVEEEDGASTTERQTSSSDNDLFE